MKIEKDVKMFEWDDDQVEMARAAKERDNKARAKYEREVAPVKQERAVKKERAIKREESAEDREQKMLSQEAKERDLKARAAYSDEIKGERLRKAKEFVQKDEERNVFRARAAAEKETIQAQTARDREERRQVAEKAKMDKLLVAVKTERTERAAKTVKQEVKTEKTTGYQKAVQKMQGDVAMRDVREVKAERALKERALKQEVRTNKAAIDRQERAQAMAVDEPKNVGGYQRAQLDEPDDRTSFAEIGEGCLMSKGHGLMYQFYTEPWAYAPS